MSRAGESTAPPAPARAAPLSALPAVPAVPAVPTVSAVPSRGAAPGTPARATSFTLLLGVIAAIALAVLVLEPPCFWRAMTGLECPTCGATRAARALVAGSPGEAFGHHAPTVFAALQIAVLGFGAFVLRLAGRPVPRPSQRTVDRILAANVVILLAAWGARLIAPG